jgi:hypothetical protein
MKHKNSIRNLEILISTVEEICALRFNICLKMEKRETSEERKGLEARERKDKKNEYLLVPGTKLFIGTVIIFVRFEVSRR